MKEEKIKKLIHFCQCYNFFYSLKTVLRNGLTVLCKQYLDGSAFAAHVCFFTCDNFLKKNSPTELQGYSPGFTTIILSYPGYKIPGNNQSEQSKA